MDSQNFERENSDCLLSQQEKYFIRSNYNKILETINLDALIPVLQRNGFFNENEKKELEKKKDGKRLEYLVFGLLLQCGTEKRLNALCNYLVAIGQNEAIQFLQYSKDGAAESSDEEGSSYEDELVGVAAVPNYDEYVGNRPVASISDNDENQCEDSSDDSEYEVTKSASSSVITKENANYATKIDSVSHTVYGNGKGDVKTLPYTAVTTENSDDDDDEYEITKAAGTAKDVKRFFVKVKEKITPKKKQGQVTTACERVDEHDGVKMRSARPTKRQGSHTSAFVSYHNKKQQPQGKGLCVIFALFTGNLPGYVKDKENLTSFFQGQLKYDVQTYENLTRKQFLSKLNTVQQMITKQGQYTKLVVAVLSHGKNDGVITCSDDDGFIMEYEDSSNTEPAVVKLDEIVDSFKHDKIPALKGCPKLFLFQNCRGEAGNVVRAAAVPGNELLSPASGPKGDDNDDDSDVHFRTKCPVDGDIMICSSTTKSHPSMVNDWTGSWFIEKTTEVFKENYDKEHVVDMMTVVNLAVAELRSTLKHENNIILAVQIPCIFSTYRKKFYLDTPPKKV